jgi:hypothetical protein
MWRTFLSHNVLALATHESEAYQVEVSPSHQHYMRPSFGWWFDISMNGNQPACTDVVWSLAESCLKRITLLETHSNPKWALVTQCRCMQETIFNNFNFSLWNHLLHCRQNLHSLCSTSPSSVPQDPKLKPLSSWKTELQSHVAWNWPPTTKHAREWSLYHSDLNRPAIYTIRQKDAKSISFLDGSDCSETHVSRALKFTPCKVSLMFMHYSIVMLIFAGSMNLWDQMV